MDRYLISVSYINVKERTTDFLNFIIEEDPAVWFMRYFTYMSRCGYIVTLINQHRVPWEEFVKIKELDIKEGKGFLDKITFYIIKDHYYDSKEDYEEAILEQIRKIFMIGG